MNLKEVGKVMKEVVGDAINEQAIASNVVEKILVPKIQAMKVKIAKGEIDLIKGTDVDAKLLMKACDVIVEKLMSDVGAKHIAAEVTEGAQV